MNYNELTSEQVSYLIKIGLKLKTDIGENKSLTIGDILENYLPKELYIDDRYYRLTIEYNTYINKWFITYEDIDCYIVITRQERLITCIFDILCWCIENDYLI